MTKQEEIREGIATVIRVNKDIFARCAESKIADELTEKLIYWMTDKIRHNLASQRVAIKVEGEVYSCVCANYGPPPFNEIDENDHNNGCIEFNEGFKARYTAWKELV